MLTNPNLRAHILNKIQELTELLSEINHDDEVVFEGSGMKKVQVGGRASIFRGVSKNSHKF